MDNNDIAYWKARANDVLARPGEHLASRSPPDAQPWTASFCGCCSPLDLCLMTWCLPCVTFGQTHHRLHKDPALGGYEPINTSCLLFCGAACLGVHWIPAALQRAAIRAKFHLAGSCVQDVVEACCCPVCALAQEEKEVQARAGTGTGVSVGGGAVHEAYKPAEGMAYPEGGNAAGGGPAATTASAATPAAATVTPAP